MRWPRHGQIYKSGGFHHGRAARHRGEAVVRHRRTRPDVCVPLEMGGYLAKQDLRTEKVWSFISQQIQIRI